MQYYFGGDYDLVRFVKLVQQAGLFVHLRIGPYACAEWNYGFVSFFLSLLLKANEDTVGSTLKPSLGF